MTRGLGTALLIVLGGTLLAGQPPQTPPPSSAPVELPPLPDGVQLPKQAPGLTMPRAIRTPKPQYTRDAMLRRVQGEVTMRAVVNTDGSVSDVILLRSLDPELDQEAMKTAQQFQFAPATLNGVPVRMAVNLVLDFNVMSQHQPPGEWPSGFASNVRRSPLAQSTVTVGRAMLTLPQLEGWTPMPAQSVGPLLSMWNPRGSLITVEQLQPQVVTVTDSPSSLQLEQIASATGRGFGQVSPVRSGQVKVQDRAWVWVELPRDAALTPPPGLLADGAKKGAQRWAFATAAGGRNLVIRYVAYLPVNAAPADAQTRIAEAAKEFSDIMNLVKITEP